MGFDLIDLLFDVYALDIVFFFVIFLLAIVLSVLRFTNYDYLFDIFKLFLSK
jgi:hypothetical protein